VNEHEASLDSLTALRAMVDPSRVRILGLLLARPMAVEELVASLDMPAPSVSHHIRLLLEAGLDPAACRATSGAVLGGC
jgi:DNA-binding transcriptional ArsR family regulator